MVCSALQNGNDTKKIYDIFLSGDMMNGLDIPFIHMAYVLDRPKKKKKSNESSISECAATFSPHGTEMKGMSRRRNLLLATVNS